MKTLTKIILGIIVIAIVVAVVYAMFFGKAGAPTIDNASGIPSSWKTYTVKSYDLSLQAPADFKLIINQGLADGNDPIYNPTFFLNIPTTTPYFHTHLINESYVLVDQGDVACSQSNAEVTSSNQVTINGTTFTRTTTSGVGAGQLYQGIDYATTKNGTCYRIFLFTHSTNGEGFYTDNAAQIKQVDAQQAQDMTALFKLFDQIAGTIKFSK